MANRTNPAQNWYRVNIRDIRQALDELATDYDTSLAIIMQACARYGLDNPAKIAPHIETLKERNKTILRANAQHARSKK